MAFLIFYDVAAVLDLVAAVLDLVAAVLDLVAVGVFVVAAVLDFVVAAVVVVACDCHQRKGDASVKYQQISRKDFLAKEKIHKINF